VRGETIASEAVRQNAETEFNEAGRNVLFAERGSNEEYALVESGANASYNPDPTRFLPETRAIEIAEEVEHLRQDNAGSDFGHFAGEIDVKLQAIRNAGEYELSCNDVEVLRQMAIAEFVGGGGLDNVASPVTGGRVFQPIDFPAELIRPLNNDPNYRPTIDYLGFLRE
jgi:hypothetical protein